MERYPFTPINIDGLEEGHYWDIRMEGRYGFGVVIGRWNRVGVLAGILDLVKQNNTISPTDSYVIFETGYVDLKSIPYCGGQIRGKVEFTTEGLVITNRTLSFSEPRAIVKKALKSVRSKARFAKRHIPPGA